MDSPAFRAYPLPDLQVFNCRVLTSAGIADLGRREELVRNNDVLPYFLHLVFQISPEHAETVVQLSKGNISSQNVRVEFSLEDMDMSRFQQGATYEQIQEWVQEKYGFHVTHLNIAQVKRKHGIIERENYNKAKSTDSKQPGCPDEKTRAIEEALRYYQMI